MQRDVPWTGAHMGVGYEADAYNVGHGHQRRDGKLPRVNAWQ